MAAIAWRMCRCHSHLPNSGLDQSGSSAWHLRCCCPAGMHSRWTARRFPRNISFLKTVWEVRGSCAKTYCQRCHVVSLVVAVRGVIIIGIGGLLGLLRLALELNKVRSSARHLHCNCAVPFFLLLCWAFSCRLLCRPIHQPRHRSLRLPPPVPPRPPQRGTLQRNRTAMPQQHRRSWAGFSWASSFLTAQHLRGPLRST